MSKKKERIYWRDGATLVDKVHGKAVINTLIETVITVRRENRYI